MKEAYISFLNHCYIDTEVEMKEIYTSNHMWSLFEKSFLVDMNHVTSSAYLMSRSEADTPLESYVTNSVMMLINTFFNSPFSDQSTTLQVSVSVYILHADSSSSLLTFTWVRLNRVYVRNTYLLVHYGFQRIYLFRLLWKITLFLSPFWYWF